MFFFCLPAEHIQVLQETAVLSTMKKNLTIPLEGRSIYSFNFLCSSIVCKAEKGDADDNKDDDKGDDSGSVGHDISIAMKSTE